MIKIDESFLPWSCYRYSLKDTGEVMENNQVIKSFIKDDNLYITLDWVLGRRDYLVSLLMLFAFHKVRNDEYLVDKIEPLFLDNNKFNISISNLIYRFYNGPIEVKNYPDFYYIPFYAEYGLSKTGSLINITTNKPKKWSFIKGDIKSGKTGGYEYSRVKNDEGFSKILFKHRALCLVFKEYDNTVVKLVVNHIDGKPSNNIIDNLEWCTYSQNLEHAYNIGLMRASQKAILVKNLITNEVKKFDSIAECCREYDLYPDYIRSRLIQPLTKVYSDFLSFKNDDDAEWPVINISNTVVYPTNRAIDIASRNVFTGEIQIFNGYSHAEDVLGISQATIASHVKNKTILPFHGYNFQQFSSKMVWPKHTEHHLQIYEKYPQFPPNGIIKTDMDTGKEIFYRSIGECALSTRILADTIRRVIHKKAIYKGKYQFQYFDLKSNLSLTDQ